MMAKRSQVGLFVLLGLAVALAFAFFVSPLASSEPDGLERVAIDQGFDGQAVDSAVAGSPLADYAVAGVDNSWLSTGLSGIVGVLLCFVIGTAVLLVIKVLRSRRPAATSTPDAPSAG
jgi:uncharacterized membrane protein